MQNVNYNFASLIKLLFNVYYCLHNSDVSMTSIAGTGEALFVPVSKNNTSSKYDSFAYGSYF